MAKKDQSANLANYLMHNRRRNRIFLKKKKVSNILLYLFNLFTCYQQYTLDIFDLGLHRALVFIFNMFHEFVEQNRKNIKCSWHQLNVKFGSVASESYV